MASQRPPAREQAHSAGRIAARLVPGTGSNAPPVTLTAGTSLVVGRHRDCGLTLADASLSRHHATLWEQDGAWWLRDEESLNGTTVNGQPVRTVALVGGDEVGFGQDTRYRFEIVEATESARESRWARFCRLGLSPAGGGRTHPLRGKLTVVGRNAGADLVLDDARVSGVHARIENDGGELKVMDSGSRNGTVVNGETIRHASLRVGDEVVFGGLAFRVVRTMLPTRRSLNFLAAGGLVLALLLLLPLVLRPGGERVEALWTREMYLSQVTESLAAAVRACDARPRITQVARAQFGIAQRSLVAADRLRPDRQTAAELRRAFSAAAAADRVSGLLRGRDAYDLLLSLDQPLEQEPESGPPDRPAGAFDLDEELSRLVAQFGVDTREQPMPDLMRAEVARCIEFWTGPKLEFTRNARRRAAPHLDMIRQELRRHQLPEIFCYLPFIESGYQERVRSSASARGMWQFMPATARDYGLRVDDRVDERTDPRKATVAACRHLTRLLEMFGPNAFMCAVAAYNKGQGGMARCLKKNANWRSSWKYWDLVAARVDCLPEETVEYVPRFLAAAIVMRRPEVFDLEAD